MRADRRALLPVMRHELRVLTSELEPIVVLAVMPLVVMAFLKPTVRTELVNAGHVGATGAEQTVPGMAVTFSPFLAGFVAYGYFREQSWRTRDRVHAAAPSTADLLIGKLVVPVGVAAVQFAVLLGGGALLYDLRVTGSIAAVMLVATAFGLCVISMGWLLVATCKTLQQVNALVNVGAIVLAGLGGALVPATGLPEWARLVGQGTPSWWAMDGFQSAIIEGGDVRDVAGSVLIVLTFALVFGTIAASRLRRYRHLDV